MKRVILFIVISTFVGGGIYGALHVRGVVTRPLEKKETPTPTDYQFPTDTPAPQQQTATLSAAPAKSIATPTLNPVDTTTRLDKYLLSVLVQNGNGKFGSATQGSEVLKTFGYHVVGTENADTFDYQQTVILVKEAKKQYLPLLQKDLATTYRIGSSSATLSASSSADAVVVIGIE